MKFGCAIGFVLLLRAAASALAGVVIGTDVPHGTLSVGWLWFQLHGNSLVGFQALIEKGLGPQVWPPIQAVLAAPAWLVLGVPAPRLTAADDHDRSTGERCRVAIITGVQLGDLLRDLCSHLGQLGLLHDSGRDHD